MLGRRRENESRVKHIAETAFIILVWLIGMVSALHLLYNALYLLFLAVIFGLNAPPTPVLGYILFVGKNAIPTFCFAAIGLTGFLLWPSERFWLLGLSAVLVETALAIYDIANPASMLILKLVPQ